MANTVLPWTQYTEGVVGLNHPTLADVDNRPLRAALGRSSFQVDAVFRGLPVGASAVNAGSSDYTGTVPVRVTAAVADAKAAGLPYMFIPRTAFDGTLMLPYTGTSATFDTTVKVLREGGPILGSQTLDAIAYGGIQGAINAATALATALNKGPCSVWLERSLLPYNAAGITFTNAAVNGVQMIREDGPTVGFDVVAYGAAANGIQDDSTAILAAAAAANVRAGGGTVYFSDFGANIFLCNSPLTFNAYTDVSFIGQGGPNQTRIIMGAAGAHCMNFTGVCSRITIRDLWLGANSALANGLGLSIVGTVGVHSDRFTIEHVTIQNVPSPFRLQYLDNSSFRDVAYYQTIAAATTGAVFSMNSSVSCYFYSCYNIVTTGTLPAEVWLVDYDTDTIILIACQALFAGTNGFSFQQSAGSTGPRLSRATDCLSESNTQYGFRIDAARDLRLNGCHAAVNTLGGYLVNGGTSVTISDSFALQNGTIGIWIAAGTAVKLEGNTCSNNSQTANNASDGITVGASGTRIIGNRSGDFVFALANKQKSGLNLQAGTDFLFVGGNDLQGNTGPGFSQPMINSSTGANNEFFGSRFLTPAEATLVAGVDTEATQTVYIEVTLTAARLVGALFSPFKGQRVVFTFIQSGAGAFAVTWNAVYKTSWADAGNATPKRSSIAYVYDGTNWNQDGAQTPYI